MSPPLVSSLRCVFPFLDTLRVAAAISLSILVGNTAGAASMLATAPSLVTLRLLLCDLLHGAPHSAPHPRGHALSCRQRRPRPLSLPTLSSSSLRLGRIVRQVEDEAVLLVGAQAARTNESATIGLPRPHHLLHPACHNPIGLLHYHRASLLHIAPRCFHLAFRGAQQVEHNSHPLREGAAARKHERRVGNATGCSD
jgi:hypothetical protein